MRKFIALTAASLTAMALAAVPASAADSGETTTTFTITSSGALAITVPTAEDLGELDVATLGLATGALTGSFVNPVTVTDTRGALVATWTTTVETKDGADGDTDPDAFLLTALPDGTTAGIDTSAANQRVEPSAVTYYPDGDPLGAGTLVNNLVSATAVVAPTAGDLNGDATGDATVTYSGVGNNEIEWTPYLDITVAADQVAGDYSGVVVHSVS